MRPNVSAASVRKPAALIQPIVGDVVGYYEVGTDRMTLLLCYGRITRVQTDDVVDLTLLTGRHIVNVPRQEGGRANTWCWAQPLPEGAR